MKSMKPFYKYAGHLLGALCLAATCFVSCSDEEWDGRPQVKEGVPVSVALPFETASASKVTTRLTDAQEFQMNDFYLLIFDAGGGVKFRQYYDSDALASLDHTNGNQANPTHGKLQLETTSGLSYIYGVANVAGSELNSNGRLKGDLDNLSSLDELKNLTATLTNAGNTQRSTAALLMSGTFHATGCHSSSAGRGRMRHPRFRRYAGRHALSAPSRLAHHFPPCPWLKDRVVRTERLEGVQCPHQVLSHGSCGT